MCLDFHLNFTVVEEYTLYDFKFYSLSWLILTENTVSSVTVSWHMRDGRHLLLETFYWTQFQTWSTTRSFSSISVVQTLGKLKGVAEPALPVVAWGNRRECWSPHSMMRLLLLQLRPRLYLKTLFSDDAQERISCHSCEWNLPLCLPLSLHWLYLVCFMRLQPLCLSNCANLMNFQLILIVGSRHDWTSNIRNHVRRQ